MAAAFLDHLRKALRKHGITLAGVRSDNGPEFTGKAFKTHAAELGLVHHRIPPRSPNHNAVCERFHGTVLREFYRPHFHRGRVDGPPSEGHVGMTCACSTGPCSGG